MAVYGVTVEHEGGTDFYAVSAATMDEVQILVSHGLCPPDDANVCICGIEDLINAQYDGIAGLCTI